MKYIDRKKIYKMLLKINIHSNIYNIIGIVFILIGVSYSIFYIRWIWKEVDEGFKNSNSKGVKKAISFIISYLVEFLSYSNSLNLYLFGFTPIILGILCLEGQLF